MKIILTIFFLLLSFFLLLVVITFFINQNLIFSEHNKFENSKSINQQDNNTVNPHLVKIKNQEKNYTDLDIFGIKKIYPTIKEGFEWFMNNSDPKSDPYLHNYKNIVKNKDGSYNIGERSRMSVYSKDGIGYSEGNMETYDFTKLSNKGYWYKPTDWKNVEITGEYLYREGKVQV